MSDISEHEARLIGALDRMSAAFESVRQKLVHAQARAAELETQNADLASELDTVKEALAKVDETAIDALKVELAVTSGAAEAARAEAEDLTGLLAAERDTLSHLKREAESDRAALDTIASELTALKARDRLEALQSGAIAEETVRRLSDLEARLQQVQVVNAQLRQNNAALRRAHQEGISDAGLVNEGLQVELDALSAARAADRAEIESILAALKPLVEETEDA
ncbi:MAG: hypothetical protein KDA73_13530 [Rhodobacteraceae bacterium]|nr:hypothetical protein [Paracoccaceae bacterium]